MCDGTEDCEDGSDEESDRKTADCRKNFYVPFLSYGTRCFHNTLVHLE